eukprot:TRINITY_DN922_c0_g2_i1.p1 TRINITY_DN922_c0_g2~~TRINITY_DN922_c0_g2_i1.p1  ORF type:complete len:149 (-),score=57.63 TRINITY_DN922_c0_g2_i1:97-543(-)
MQVLGLEPELNGIEKWVHDYQSDRPDVQKLQAQVDRFMKAFDERSEMEKQAEKKGPIVDKDGFILVTGDTKKKKRKLNTKPSTTSATSSSSSTPSSEKRKKKAPAVFNLYRFQERQQKMDQLKQLRSDFEEDKKKISKMREQRKFRPL